LSRREDNTGTNNDKKHKVIHARVSEALEDELKRRATHLGMSVSNLVRNILQHTVGLVEEIMEDGARLTARITRPQPPPASDRVLAWQEAVLNLNAVCEQCNVILQRGARAAIAVTDGIGRRSVLCPSCLEILSNAELDTDENQ
jgi:hypothetical protein